MEEAPPRAATHDGRCTVTVGVVMGGFGSYSPNFGVGDGRLRLQPRLLREEGARCPLEPPASLLVQ